VELVTDRALPSLSEEELAVLHPADTAGQRLVPLPRFDALAGEERWNALSAGLRSLLDRGLLSTAADPDAPPRLQGGAETIAAARELPALVVVADRTRAGERRSRYLYGVEPGVLLEEDPAGDGVHGFRLRPAERAAGDLVALADPTGRARDDGDVLDLADEAAREAVERSLAGAEAVTQLYAVRRGAPGVLDEYEASLAACPDGVWLVAGGEGGTAARLVSPASLETFLRRLLEPPL
jgi:hypothetical protein